MNEQLSLLPDLDRASDTRKANLCRTWKNAIKGDYVYVENLYRFKEGKDLAQYVEINCALCYPKVYYTFDITDGVGGRFSLPAECDSNFDVHECTPNVMLMVEHALRDACRGYKVKESFIKGALRKMELSIKE